MRVGFGAQADRADNSDGPMRLSNIGRNTVELPNSASTPRYLTANQAVSQQREVVPVLLREPRGTTATFSACSGRKVDGVH